MPSEVRERIKMHINTLLIEHDIDTTIITSKEVDFKADAILAVIGAEIEGMKEIYPHEETCRCKECVGVYYKNKTLTDLRARLENKNGM